MTDALLPLALAVLGLPTVVRSVALVARHFVYRHADQEAEQIRAAVADRRRRSLAEVEEVASR